MKRFKATAQSLNAVINTSPGNTNPAACEASLILMVRNLSTRRLAIQSAA